MKGCQSWHCTASSPDRDLKSECCATCKTGIQIPITERPSYTISPYTTMAPPVTPDSRVCDDLATINGYVCEEFIRKYGQHVCYDSVVESHCCQSCSRIKVTHDSKSKLRSQNKVAGSQLHMNLSQSLVA